MPRDIIENIDSKPSIESSPTYSNPSQAYSYPVTYPVNLEERNEPASNLQNIDEPAKKISAETDDSDNTQTTTQESSKPEDKPYRPWTNVEEAYLKSNLPYPRSHGVSSKVDPKLLTELQRRESQKLEKWQKILPTLESSLEKSNSTGKRLRPKKMGLMSCHCFPSQILNQKGNPNISSKNDMANACECSCCEAGL